MYRVLTSSSRAVAQRVVRSTLTFTRAESNTDPEAGSVSGGKDAFGKREKAEETRWARRFEAEQAAKYRTAHDKPAEGGAEQRAGNKPQAGNQQKAGSQGAGGSSQQRLAALEEKKRKLQQEIDELKRN